MPTVTDLTPPTEFAFDIRVYYEDTDVGGIVFYANYLKFFERARTEWLRALGFEQSDMADRLKRIFVVAGLNMDYRKPARLDDLLTIRSRVSRLGRVSVHFSQRAERRGELLAQGSIQVCCVDTIQMRPAELPPDVRASLQSTQE